MRERLMTLLCLKKIRKYLHINLWGKLKRVRLYLALFSFHVHKVVDNYEFDIEKNVGTIHELFTVFLQFKY